MARTTFFTVSSSSREGVRHFSVRKKESKERTQVHVARLDKSERIKEIARMMGGEKITSVVTRHAEELIKGGG